MSGAWFGPALKIMPRDASSYPIASARAPWVILLPAVPVGRLSSRGWLSRLLLWLPRIQSGGRRRRGRPRSCSLGELQQLLVRQLWQLRPGQYSY